MRTFEVVNYRHITISHQVVPVEDESLELGVVDEFVVTPWREAVVRQVENLPNMD
jgi:hypothetical protein